MSWTEFTLFPVVLSWTLWDHTECRSGNENDVDSEQGVTLLLGKNIASSYPKYFFLHLYSQWCDLYSIQTWVMAYTVSLKKKSYNSLMIFGNLRITDVCPPQCDSWKCLQKTKSQHIWEHSSILFTWQVRNYQHFHKPELE